MEKKRLLNMKDYQLDAAVKIQGTDFDKKRVVTKKMLQRMKKMETKGKTYSEIAEKFNVTPRTVRYNLDSAWREYYNATRSGAHTGVDTVDKADRIARKRRLVLAGANVRVVK